MATTPITPAAISAPAQTQAQTGAPPDGYEVEQRMQNVPAFLRPTAAKMSVQMEAPRPDAAAEVSAIHPQTVQVFGADQATQPVITHEVTHGFQASRSLPLVAHTASQLMLGDNNPEYGGEAGLAEAQRQGKTIADFNPEQQAHIVEDYQTQTQDAIRRGDAAALDRVTAIYHPVVRQLAQETARGESMTTMTPSDLHLEAPGLPPATVTGMLVPDKLLGGEGRILKNPPPSGYTVEAKTTAKPTAQKIQGKKS